MKRIIIGMSGASGAIYGIRLLQVLQKVAEVETHLVLTSAARRTLTLETDYTVEQIERLADKTYKSADIAACLSSGSFRATAMIVVPCSMKTVSGIATSYSDNLLLRAADVMLKERRRLLLVVRETPLHLGHLKLLVQVAEMGAIVMPPVPAMYHRPDSLEAVIDQTVNRALDILDIELEQDLFPRWQGATGNERQGTRHQENGIFSSSHITLASPDGLSRSEMCSAGVAAAQAEKCSPTNHSTCKKENSDDIVDS